MITIVIVGTTDEALRGAILQAEKSANVIAGYAS